VVRSGLVGRGDPEQRRLVEGKCKKLDADGQRRGHRREQVAARVQRVVHEHLRLEGHALLAGYLAAAGPDLPVVERIRAMGRAYHRFGLEHPREYALMFNVRAEETPRHEALVREMETLMQLRRVVEEGIARGELRADIDPMVTTNALWAQIHGVTALTVSRLLAETTHGDEAAVVEAVLDATTAWIVRR